MRGQGCRQRFGAFVATELIIKARRMGELLQGKLDFGLGSESKKGG